MPQSLSRVYVHIIFSTKNREKLIPPDDMGELFAYIGGILNNMDCRVIAVGGMSDHVHILCMQSRGVAMADIVEQLKRSTSFWMQNKKKHRYFAWQNGYGAFSVSYNHVDAVKQYIATQAEHHRHRTFAEEFRAWLEKYHLDFDERYLL